jgi:hypothetical protein
MASKPRAPQRATPAAPLAPDRARRLYRLLRLVSRRPQTRDAVTTGLALDVRGFYRDLETLRKFAIEVDFVDGRYLLHGKLDAALAKLPFPDPGLTFTEAVQLARGRSKAHRKLKKQLAQITKG